MIKGENKVMRYLFMVCVLMVSFLYGKDVNSSSISLAKKSDKPYVKSLMRNMAHPDVWKSRKRKKILEILYGKDIHMVQSDKLKITDGIKIQTDLKLKSIAILRGGYLIAWYPVNDGNPVNISLKVKYGTYTVVGEGLNEKFYINTHTQEEDWGSCIPSNNLKKKYKFYNAHLKRKIIYHDNIAHVEFMIVNDTLEKDDLNSGIERKIKFYPTQIRIEAGGKTVYTLYLNRSYLKNPYFTVDLYGVKKDEKITIFCIDTKYRQEYILEDKLEFAQKYEKK